MPSMRFDDKEGAKKRNLLSEESGVPEIKQAVRLSLQRTEAEANEGTGVSSDSRRNHLAPLVKIISGGQIGADIAALRAAKRAGLDTGGWMPHGYKALDGNHPEYAEEFGMFHTNSPDYVARTIKNVMWSDGTLRIAYNFDTYGEKATLREIRKWSKPHYDIQLPNADSETELANVKLWLTMHDIKILNVAGNATTKIEPFVEEFITKLIKGVDY